MLNDYKFEGEPLTIGLEKLLVLLFEMGVGAAIGVLGLEVLRYIPIGPHYKTLKKVKNFKQLCLNIIN